MSSRDLHNNIKTDTAFNIQAISSDTTTPGNIIDTAEFEGLEFILLASTLTAGDFTPFIEDDDDPTFLGSVAVLDDFLIGTEAEAAYIGGSGDNTTRRIGYIGKKRYVRLSIVSENGADGTLGAIVIKSFPRSAPTANDV